MKSDIKGETSVHINASISQVWDALTNPVIIKKYLFGTTAVSDWKTGSPLIFKGEWQGKQYEDHGRILESIPGKELKYTYWSSMSGIEDKPENYAHITYRITGVDNDVTLTVIQENIPDEKMKEHSLENWNKVLSGLKNLVSNDPIVIEQTYNAPAEKVWKAISDRDEMKKWYFDLAEFKPEPGFEFNFEAGPPGKMYVHQCKVTEAEPPKKLTYSWRYEGYTGNSFVTWELTGEGDKTRLRLTHKGLDTFPAVPELAKHNFVEGWTQILGTSLKEYLEGKN